MDLDGDGAHLNLISDEEPEKVEAKEEDEKADHLALEALERERAAVLAQLHASEAAAAAPKGKRKRGRSPEDVAMMDANGAAPAKRRRQQPSACLVDTGKMKTTVTSTTLMNLKPMFYLSSHMTFSHGPAMRTQRGACSFASLDPSYMLVVGGNASAVSFATTEVLDLKTMAFVGGPTMRERRSGSSAVMLDAGRLLVIGGYDGSTYLDTTEVLILSTNEFLPGPKLRSRRAAAAVAMLACGILVVAGGKNAQGCLDSIEFLDVRTEPLNFVQGPRMSVSRGGACIAQLNAEQMLVIGGHDSSRTHDTTEILTIPDAASVAGTGQRLRGAFTPGPLVAAPRSYAAAVMLNPGNVHIIGGHDGRACLESTEVLRLSTMEFTSGPRLRRGRFMCGAAVVSEGRLMVVGGTDGNGDHNTTEVLNLPSYSYLPQSLKGLN
eukprot:TRINITY_DN5394_c0_g4_i4.p1 TRINITY_DN5394_c0_g4~~TRINITY_DN5394_c0_g4_i4.p1  ORF type:complete len:466 (+),score=89.05 TRINITY_DN5394_c0_g4_i4:91-1398(+)